MRGTLSIVTGQAIWAVAQASIVLFLAHRGAFSVIGAYVLGLSILTPLCLLGGLNLRVLVALDGENAICARAAILLRAAITLLALAMTGGILLIVTPERSDAISALFLVATRIGDQLSDVANGYQQKNGNHDAIGRSFLIRGAALILPFLVIFAVNMSMPSLDIMLVLGLGCAITTLLASLIVDIWPLWRRSNALHSTWLDIGVLLRNARHIAGYPLLDSLHMNSFRYAIFLTSSAEYLGLIGVAQTLYVPFQLLGTALGYPFLSRLRETITTKPADFWRLTWQGIGMGLAIGGVFLICGVIVPEAILSTIFSGHGASLKPALMLVGIAMLPMLACGFAAQSLAAQRVQMAYILAPTAGFLLFWCAIAIAFVMSPTSWPVLIAALFFLSGVIRLAIAIRVIWVGGRET